MLRLRADGFLWTLHIPRYAEYENVVFRFSNALCIRAFV